METTAIMALSLAKITKGTRKATDLNIGKTGHPTITVVQEKWRAL